MANVKRNRAPGAIRALRVKLDRFTAYRLMDNKKSLTGMAKLL